MGKLLLLPFCSKAPTQPVGTAGERWQDPTGGVSGQSSTQLSRGSPALWTGQGSDERAFHDSQLNTEAVTHQPSASPGTAGHR